MVTISVLNNEHTQRMEQPENTTSSLTQSGGEHIKINVSQGSAETC